MAPKKGSHRAGFTVGGDDEQNGSGEPSPTILSPPRREPQQRLPKFTSIPDPSQGESSEDDESRWHPTSGPQTPSISESAQQLRRSLSVQGLQHLANMPPSELRRSVGKKIWRPENEEARMPSDWERLAVHVVRGGVRGFNLAFMLRGCVMILFALIRAVRTK